MKKENESVPLIYLLQVGRSLFCKLVFEKPKDVEINSAQTSWRIRNHFSTPKTLTWVAIGKVRSGPRKGTRVIGVFYHNDQSLSAMARSISLFSQNIGKKSCTHHDPREVLK